MPGLSTGRRLAFRGAVLTSSSFRPERKQHQPCASLRVHRIPAATQGRVPFSSAILVGLTIPPARPRSWPTQANFSGSRFRACFLRAPYGVALARARQSSPAPARVGVRVSTKDAQPYPGDPPGTPEAARITLVPYATPASGTSFSHRSRARWETCSNGHRLLAIGERCRPTGADLSEHRGVRYRGFMSSSMRKRSTSRSRGGRRALQLRVPC